MPKRGRQKRDDDDDDEWFNDVDDTPNMSQGAGSSSTNEAMIATEMIATEMIQMWWKKARYHTASKCPFNSSMINQALKNHIELREDIRNHLPLLWDQREGYEDHVIGGDCCCKGDKPFTAAELQAHGAATAHVNGGSLGKVHHTLSQFLIGQGFGASPMEPAATIRSQIGPMAASEEVSWPPLVVLRTERGYEKLIMSKGEASKYLGAVAKATEYVPVYTAPAPGSHEASQFLGQVVLVFKGSVADQDSMLDAAVGLREEVDAQCKPDGRSIFASASFLDRAHYLDLPASCKSKLEKSNGGRPFEWRKLHEERRRARDEAGKRAAVRTCACTCTCAHLLRRLKRIERSPRIKPLTGRVFRVARENAGACGGPSAIRRGARGDEGGAGA